MKTNHAMKSLEERLHQWADWYSSGNFFGLGYPPCSLEYRMMHEAVVFQKTGPRPLLTNERAEETERLVKEMAQHNALIANVLRCHYFSTGGLREQAKHMNMSHSHFKHQLDMAYQWLAGRLSNYKSEAKMTGI